MTDWPPWLVWTRDYFALWLFRVKEAKGQIGLLRDTAWTAIGAFGVLKGTEWEYLWWAIPVLLVAGGLAYAWLNDKAKVPNATNRVDSARSGNYIHPRLAMRMLIQARQLDAICDCDVEAETRALLNDYVRGIDMEQFERELDGD